MTTHETICSFCNKQEDDVYLMFTKELGVNICSECVLELNKMLMTNIEMQVQLNKMKTNLD